MSPAFPFWKESSFLTFKDSIFKEVSSLADVLDIL